MDSSIIKREEKVIAKEEKQDRKALSKAQKEFESAKKKDAKLIKEHAKAEKQHQKAIKKEHKAQAALDKATQKHNSALRLVEEKEMKLRNNEKARNEHSGSLRQVEQGLVTAQSRKEHGDSERNLHKQNLVQVSSSHPPHQQNEYGSSTLGTNQDVNALRTAGSVEPVGSNYARTQGGGGMYNNTVQQNSYSAAPAHVSAH